MPQLSGFDVAAFGAVADGVTDCSQAFRRAIEEAVLNKASVVVIPAGTFLITESGTFSPPTGAVINGFSFHGAGLGATTIVFANPDAEVAPENNYLMRVENNALRVHFHGIRFNGDPVNKKSRFLYLTSAGQAQSIRFTDCMWYQFENIETLEGTANASEMLHIGCKTLVSYGKQFRYNNLQSVNHQFIGCDLEVAHDDIFYFKKGGNLNVFGGSIIMGPVGATTGAVINLDSMSGADIGPNNWLYTFNGAKFELHDSSMLVRNNSLGLVALNDCGIRLTGVLTRNIVDISQGGRVAVRGGHFNGKTILRTSNASAWAASFRPATLTVDQASLGDNFDWECEGMADKYTPTINNVGGLGRVRVRDCRAGQVSYTSDVRDMDFNWQYGNTNDAMRPKFARARGPNTSNGLPTPGQALTVKLPPGAVVVSVRLFHAKAPGPASQSYALTNADGSKTLAAWTVSADVAQNAVTPIWHECSSENDRVLKFTGHPANAAGSLNGYLLIEYY